MSSSTLKRLTTLRLYVRVTRGWTLERFAKDLGFSPSYVKALERGERRITPRVEAKLRKLENTEAWVAKEIKDANAEMIDWLITALEQRQHLLGREERCRLGKLLEK